MQEYKLGQPHDEEVIVKEKVEVVKTSEEGVKLEETPKVSKKKKGD